MQFPDFQDFLKVFDDKDRANEILENKNALKMFQIDDIKDERNLNAFISSLVTDTLNRAVSINVRLLYEYHQWLSEKLEQQ